MVSLLPHGLPAADLVAEVSWFQHPTRAERHHAAEQVKILAEILLQHRRFNQELRDDAERRAREPDPNVDRHRAFAVSDADFTDERLYLCDEGIHVAQMETDRCALCHEKLY